MHDGVVLHFFKLDHSSCDVVLLRPSLPPQITDQTRGGDMRAGGNRQGAFRSRFFVHVARPGVTTSNKEAVSRSSGKTKT